MKPVLWLACMATLLIFSQISVAADSRVRKQSNQVPKYSIKTTCGEAAIATGTDNPGQNLKNCMADEQAALKTITDKWSTFKSATRRTCVEAGATPNPSYVELITCLEMFDNKFMPNAPR